MKTALWKVIALLLALSMLLPLAGCGSKNEDTSKKDSAAEKEEEKEKEKEEEEKKDEENGEEETIASDLLDFLYLKDYQIYYYDVVSKKPVKLTSNCIDKAQLEAVNNAENYYGMDPTDTLLSNVCFSKDGTKVFYADNVNLTLTEEEYSSDLSISYDVYYRDLGKADQAPVKLCGNVTDFDVNKDGTRIRFAEGDKFFTADITATAISNKASFPAWDVAYISQDFKTMIYGEQQPSDDEYSYNSTYDYYLWESGEITHLFTGGYSYSALFIPDSYYISGTISEFRFLDNDNKFCRYDMNTKSTTLILDGVAELLNYNENDGSFYYAPESGSYIEKPMRDFIINDTDGTYEEYGVSDWNTLSMSVYAELYFFDGKASHLVAENVCQYDCNFLYEGSMGTIAIYHPENIEKLKLSELPGDYSDVLRDALDSTMETKFVIGHQDSGLNAANMLSPALANDGKTLYYIEAQSHEEESDYGWTETVYDPGILYKVSIADGKAGAPEKYAENVLTEQYGSSVVFFSGSLYYKTQKKGEDTVSYYKDKTCLVENANEYTILMLDGTVIRGSDMDEETGTGTITAIKNGKETVLANKEKIGDSSFLYSSVLFLKNGSEETGGDLYYYTDGTVTKLDTGVQKISNRHLTVFY